MSFISHGDRDRTNRTCPSYHNWIAENQLGYVKGKRTAEEAWDELRNSFERVEIVGKLFLRKQFQELKLMEGGDVKLFLLQFEKVLREMRAAGVKMDAEDVALPKFFDALITAWETIQPEHLTLEYVKKRLLDEQVMRNGQGILEQAESGSRESAFSGKKEFKYFGCGHYGHNVRSVDGKGSEKNIKFRSGRFNR